MDDRSLIGDVVNCWNDMIQVLPMPQYTEFSESTCVLGISEQVYRGFSPSGEKSLPGLQVTAKAFILLDSQVVRGGIGRLLVQIMIARTTAIYPCLSLGECGTPRSSSRLIVLLKLEIVGLFPSYVFCAVQTG